MLPTPPPPPPRPPAYEMVVYADSPYIMYIPGTCIYTARGRDGATHRPINYT